MNKLVLVMLLMVGCGREMDTQEYRYLNSTMEPSVVVDDMRELPVCLNQCDVMKWRGFGLFYCDGSPQWIPLTSPVNCPIN